jgi:arginyl-tRNA synthetase
VDLDLSRLAAQFPRVVEGAANAREPHRIAFYLNDLASAFHSWYNLGNDDPSRRAVSADNITLTLARLFMVNAIGQILRNGMALMGVEPAEEMR